jgi:integrase
MVRIHARQPSSKSLSIDNGYVEANPCHGIDKMAKKRDIDILTVEEVDRLLRECDPKMVPFYAIGIFCGLRPMSELMRAEWEDIKDGSIEVKNVKTAGHANQRERAVRRRVAEPRRMDRELQEVHEKWHFGGPYRTSGHWNKLAYEAPGKRRGIDTWARYHEALVRLISLRHVRGRWQDGRANGALEHCAGLLDVPPQGHQGRRCPVLEHRPLKRENPPGIFIRRVSHRYVRYVQFMSGLELPVSYRF